MKKFVSFIVVGSFLWSGYVHASHYEDRLSSSSSASSLDSAVQECFSLESLPNEIVGMVIQQFCKRPDFKPADFKYIVNLAKTNRHFRDIVRAELPIYFKEARANATECEALDFYEDKQEKLDKCLPEVIRGGNLPELVESLINHGAHICLFKVIKGGIPLKSVEYLVALGAHINQADQNGSLPIHQAGYAKRSDIIRFLIANGAFVMAREQDGWNLLHTASMCEDLDSATLVLETVSSYENKALLREFISARTTLGWTPLHGAVDHGKEMAGLLLGSAQQFGDVFVKEYVNTRASNYATPLHTAVGASIITSDEKSEIVQLLLSYGADPRIKNINGDRPSECTNDIKIKELLKEREKLLDEQDKIYDMK